jgi:pimeloyl-ACP methyl ester carboxylesterase
VNDFGDFESRIQDKTAAIAEDFSSDSDVLIVALGGFAGGMGIPPFEFFKITSEYDTNRVFVRDIPQAMYHVSLPEVPGGVDGLVARINEQRRAHGIRRTVVVGNSGGGYGALLVGALLEADEVLAFSPVSFIGPLGRLVHRDRRAPMMFLRAWLSRDGNWRYFDIKNVLRTHARNSAFHIYYCSTGEYGRLDTTHAMRLAGFPNVSIYRFDSGGHNLVKLLRDEGKLDGILRRALFGETGYSPESNLS